MREQSPSQLNSSCLPLTHLHPLLLLTRPAIHKPINIAVAYDCGVKMSAVVMKVSKELQYMSWREMAQRLSTESISRQGLVWGAQAGGTRNLGSC